MRSPTAHSLPMRAALLERIERRLPALLFTFMLGSTAFISVFRSFRNMNDLSISSVHALPCHAGQELSVEVLGAAREGQGQRIRLAIDAAQSHADAQQGRLSWRLKLPTEKRGWQSIGHLRVSTEWPLGMFHMWSWVRPDWRALIYPQPEVHAPPLPLGGDQANTQRSLAGHEDLRWIRDYQSGDAPRLIAWKASAHSDRLLSRELEDPQGNQIELDWHQVTGMELELRISRLTAWVIEARRRELRWTLRLPQDQLGPGSDDVHLHRCLRALALLPASP